MSCANPSVHAVPTVRMPRICSVPSPMASGEQLAVRLARSRAAVDALVQRWVDGGLERLADHLRRAVHAFESWRRVAPSRRLGQGELVAAAYALLERIEPLFPEGTPASDRVLEVFIDRQVDLLDAAAVARWLGSRRALGVWVEALVDDLAAALANFGPFLAHQDWPAWNAIGLCLVDEPLQAEFAWRVLVGRGGVPQTSATLVYELWQATAEATCRWDLGRWLESLRQSDSRRIRSVR